MKTLRPSELMAILAELKKQKLAEAYSEQRNKWAFLASVITNGFAAIAGMFSRRKPKMTEPDDFISKDFKRLAEDVFGESRSGKKVDWDSLISEAKAKGLKGPWLKP